MLKAEEWAKDKPTHIAIIAQQLINIVNCYFDVTSESSPEFLPIENLIEYPPTKKWLSFYRNNKHITNSIISKAKANGNQLGLLGNAIEFILKLPTDKQTSQATSSANQQSDLNIGLEDVKPHIENSYQELLQLLSPDEIQLSAQAQKAFQNPAMLFFIKVTIPCLFFYNKHPTILYRYASLGAPQALDDLLRLDKATFCDSRISDHIYKAFRENNSHLFDQFTEALKKKPKFKTARLNAKNNIAGLISVLSEAFGHKLTAQDIKALFDALAVDAGKHDLIDPDLPFAPEAWIKNVQRARKIWLSIF